MLLNCFSKLFLGSTSPKLQLDHSRVSMFTFTNITNTIKSNAFLRKFEVFFFFFWTSKNLSIAMVEFLQHRSMVSQTLLGILTIRRLLGNYYISINVGMDYVTISTATNGSLYAHQAVFLSHNDNTTNNLGK